MREMLAPLPGPHVRIYPLWRHSAWGWTRRQSHPLQWLHPSLSSAPLPHRDNQAYVKTTCSFDSHQLISDPIEPKSTIVRPSKCLKSACAGEKGCTLYPANHSWHSCHCCHGLGSGVVKTLSMSWLGKNDGALKKGLSVRQPHWSANAGGKCRQVSSL